MSVTRGDRPTDPPGPSGSCGLKFQGWKFLICCPLQPLPLVSCNLKFQIGLGFVQIYSIFVGEPGRNSQPGPNWELGSWLLWLCSEDLGASGCRAQWHAGSELLGGMWSQDPPGSGPLPHILVWLTCLAFGDTFTLLAL